MTPQEMTAALSTARVNGLCAASRGPSGEVRPRCNVYLLARIHPQLSFDAQLAAAWETGYEEGLKGLKREDDAMKSAIETAERRGFAEARRGADFTDWDSIEELKAAMGWSAEPVHPQHEPLSTAFERGHYFGKLTQASNPSGISLWAICGIGLVMGLVVKFLF